MIGGCALAFPVSFVAVAIYDRQFTPADNQSTGGMIAGGMIAGGEMMHGIGVFLLVAEAGSYNYEIKYEFKNMKRWVITKLDGGTGIPEGL